MPTPAPSPSVSPEEETIIPTFETQKLARTYILDVPAPRGQITDRNGESLAQNKLSYNLTISFPTPLDFSDAQTLSFAREKIDRTARLIGRKLKISDDAILRHYHNRGVMPMEIAQNLSELEYEQIKNDPPPGVIVRPIYVRVYPNGKVAGQIIGYTGKTGRNPDGIVDNHETLWPETEGREGLEQTFNEMLTGKRAFEGKSQISVASAILDKEPEPITKIHPMAPAAVDHVVQECIAKDPEARWQSAADVARGRFCFKGDGGRA